VSKWLAEFIEKTRVERVLLSAHHPMNKMLIQVLLQRDWSEWLSGKQDNACLNILEYVASEARPILLNCTQHLNNEV
jgi:broad specificity phosphatase PhoE